MLAAARWAICSIATEHEPPGAAAHPAVPGAAPTLVNLKLANCLVDGLVKFGWEIFSPGIYRPEHGNNDDTRGDKLSHGLPPSHWSRGPDYRTGKLGVYGQLRVEPRGAGKARWVNPGSDYNATSAAVNSVLISAYAPQGPLRVGGGKGREAGVMGTEIRMGANRPPFRQLWISYRR